MKNPAKALQQQSTCDATDGLFEISGITDVDGHTIACVQDEEGSIYIYDIRQCKTTRKVQFGGPGDYEAITRVGKDMYVLRSDGHLFKVEDALGAAPVVTEIATEIPAKNIEGLGYDEKRNRLLLAPKEKYKDEKYEKHYRAVYAYDLKTGKFHKKPVLELGVKDVAGFLESTGIALGKKKSGKKDFDFHIAGIASHPSGKHHYLVINDARAVLVVGEDGKLLSAHNLSDDFPKPEGITLLDSETLVVSSEGTKSNAAKIASFQL